MFNKNTFVLFIVFIFLSLHIIGQSTQSANRNLLPNQFIYKPFAHKSTLADFSKNYKWFSKISYKTTKNIHNRKIDTVYTFKASKSAFEFYHSATNKLFYKALIANRRIKLSHGIKIGMKKDKLLRKFGGKDVGKDTYQIVDKDGLSKCTFYFRSNRLNKIHIEYYID